MTTQTEALKRIASELRYYNPLADKYKGEFIHKVWAKEIEELLAQQSNEQVEPVAHKKARIHWLCQEWKEDHLSDINFVEAIIDECLAHPPVPTAQPHDLYTDADKNKPDAICDRNGQVALAQCKRCGKAEIELDEPCISAQPKEPRQRNVSEHLEPVANVVLRDGSPTLLRERDIKPTDKRLYTTPPQLTAEQSSRTLAWVGLTEAELREIIDETGFGILMNVWFDKHDGNPKKVLQAIELKLKEKNT